MEGRFHVHTLITVLNELEMFEHQRTACGCIHVYVCVCRNKRNMLLLTERKRSWRHMEGTYMHRHTITIMVLGPHLNWFKWAQRWKRAVWWCVLQ